MNTLKKKKQPSKKTALVLYFSTLFLSACVGDSDVNSSTTHVNLNQEKANEPLVSQSFVISDTTNLPQPPENINPILLKESTSSIIALREGIYKIGKAYVDNLEDCNSTNGTSKDCITINKIYYDERTNKFEDASWVYSPSKKQWFKLFFSDSFDIGLRFSGIEVISDGKSFFKNTFSQYRPVISSNSFTYNLGDSEVKLIGSSKSLKNQAISSVLDSTVTGTYSANAESVRYALKVAKGTILGLDTFKTEVNGKSISKTYPSLNDFRKSHVNKKDMLCLRNDLGLVFDANTYGAKVHKTVRGCKNFNSFYDKTIKTTYIIDEGIKTIGSRQFMYLSQTPEDKFGSNTSQRQWLRVFGINPENNKLMLGREFQTGYIQETNDVYLNKSAALDIVKLSLNQDINIP